MSPVDLLRYGLDVFIAAEGVGTFEGLSLERRLEKLLMGGKDAYKMEAMLLWRPVSSS
jgi:hypothetical protein